jgi:hypothetical protein
VNDFSEYMEVIVEPTFEDFRRNGGSVRHGYLACVAVYHAVDRAAYPDDPIALAEQWRKESQEFMLVEEVAQHFKHGQRRWVKKAKAANHDALLITHPLGLEGGLKGCNFTRCIFWRGTRSYSCAASSRLRIRELRRQCT